MARKPVERQNETVFGGPTKRLFVSMLTRDIELGDAILDLVDNCVDGAMRSKRGHLNTPRPFDGFQASLVLSKDRFEISDNCGGIPEDFVEDAFSLGRPNIEKDGDLPTIGMYGIGMKRAIFKIGEEASVQSNSKSGFFSVEYSSQWLNPDDNTWELPITKSSYQSRAASGVTIHIPKLKSEIAKQFGNASFVNSLKRQISEHFGYIMQKGFKIFVNGAALRPSTLAIYSGEHTAKDAIQAYDFEDDRDGVHIKVTVGLFRQLAREAEIDEETEGATDTEKAGISVICNDRLVLMSDRSLRTGWGDGGVPRFHPQFRAIAGLIIFSSNIADKLPISTTKRDLDAGSEIYLVARRATMEGLKIFTDFTNKWKGMEDGTTKFFEGKRVEAKNGISLAKVHGSPVRGEPGVKRYLPKLPLPESKDPRRRVSFVRNESDIRTVSKYLFDDVAQHPSLVGAECFDRMLSSARPRTKK